MSIAKKIYEPKETQMHVAGQIEGGKGFVSIQILPTENVSMYASLNDEEVIAVEELVLTFHSEHDLIQGLEEIVNRLKEQ